MDNSQDCGKNKPKEKPSQGYVEASSTGGQYQKTPESIAACTSVAQTRLETASQSSSSTSVLRRASVSSFGSENTTHDASHPAHSSGFRRASVASTTSTGFAASSKNLEESIPITRHMHKVKKVIASKPPTSRFIHCKAPAPTRKADEVGMASDTAQNTLRGEETEKSGNQFETQSGATLLQTSESPLSLSGSLPTRPASPPIVPALLIKTQSSISESSDAFKSVKDLERSSRTTRYVHGEPKVPSPLDIFSREHSSMTSPTALSPDPVLSPPPIDTHPDATQSFPEWDIFSREPSSMTSPSSVQSPTMVASPPAEDAQPSFTDAESVEAAAIQDFPASEIFSTQQSALNYSFLAPPLPEVSSSVTEAPSSQVQAAISSAARAEDNEMQPGRPLQGNEGPQTGERDNQ